MTEPMDPIARLEKWRGEKDGGVREWGLMTLSPDISSGRRIQVNLYDAGAESFCPKCGASSGYSVTFSAPTLAAAVDAALGANKEEV